MVQNSITATVMFENPFWIMILEKVEKGELSVSKVTFGAEPKNYEVHEFILNNYNRLKFSLPVEVTIKEMHANPKRKQRDAARFLMQKNLGKKSWQALSLQHEQNKLERREDAKHRREEAQERLFQMKQQKKKEKHRGH